MKVTYLVVLMVAVSMVLIPTGCAYQRQVKELEDAYHSGRISADDYFARRAELQRLEIEKGRALSEAMDASHKRSQPQIIPIVPLRQRPLQVQLVP